MGQNFVVNVCTGIMIRKMMIVMIKIMIFLMKKITGKKCIICSDYEIDIRSCVRHQVSLFCMLCGPCWAVLDQLSLFVYIAMICHFGQSIWNRSTFCHWCQLLSLFCMQVAVQVVLPTQNVLGCAG